MPRQPVQYNNVGNEGYSSQGSPSWSSNGMYYPRCIAASWKDGSTNAIGQSEPAGDVVNDGISQEGQTVPENVPILIGNFIPRLVTEINRRSSGSVAKNSWDGNGYNRINQQNEREWCIPQRILFYQACLVESAFWVVIHSDPAPCARETVRVVDKRDPRKQEWECYRENDDNWLPFVEPSMVDQRMVEIFVEKDESGEVNDDGGGKQK